MFNFKSVKTKLVVYFLAVSLIPICIISFVIYFSGKNIIQKQISNDFYGIAQSKEQALISYLREKVRRADAFSKDRYVHDLVFKINQKGADAEGSAIELNRYILEDKMSVDNQLTAIHICNPDGKIIISSDKGQVGVDKSNDDYFIQGKIGPHIKDVYISSVTNEPAIAFSAPIKDKKTGELLGVIVNRYAVDRIAEIVGDRTGLGNTGESYIINKNGYFITGSRFREGVVLKEKLDIPPVKLFQAQRKELVGIYSDYRGRPVLGASMGLDLGKVFDLGWLIIAEIDAPEAFSGLGSLTWIILGISIISGVFILVFALKLAAQIAKPIVQLSIVTEEAGRGDLSKFVTVESNDEIGLLAKSFNDMVKNLKEVLTKAKDATSNITSSGQEILAASQQQAAAAREQSSAVAETSTAAKQLAVSAEEVGKSIKRVSEASGHALVGMAKIKESISKTNQLINALGEKSQKIVKITELIDDVADQTNLLAVNASIEAARAGEQGRGFTVVADEIRKLSDSTAKSTKDITALVELIQHEMTNSIMSMEQSVNSVEEETRLAQETAESSKEIAMSVTQQISGSKQIADAMLNIDEAMKQVASGAQAAQIAVKQLTGLAHELKELTDKFKLA